MIKEICDVSLFDSFPDLYSMEDDLLSIYLDKINGGVDYYSDFNKFYPGFSIYSKLELQTSKNKSINLSIKQNFQSYFETIDHHTIFSIGMSFSSN